MDKKVKIRMVLILCFFLVINIVSIEAIIADNHSSIGPCYIYGEGAPYVGMPISSICNSPGGWGIYRDTTTNLEYSVRTGYDRNHNPIIIYVTDNPTPYQPTSGECECETTQQG